MKKQIIIGVVAIVAVILLFSFFITLIIGGIDKEKNKYESKVGSTFILEGDTTTIVDYSSVMETFTLSNGKKVGAALIFKKQ